jgi:hypothetical protein
MADPSQENRKLAQRLLTIGTLLRDGAPPPAKANGHGRGEPMENYPPASVLTGADLDLILEAIGRSVGTELRSLKKENAELKAEIAKCLKDGGTWNAEKLFHPGEVATYRGVPWVCNNSNTNTKPGTSDDWRLMMKSH